MIVVASSVRERGRQRGAALLVLLGMLAGLGVALLLPADAAFKTNSQSLQRDRLVARELQQAKEALLAYAISYADNYRPSGAGVGHLPCPDLDPVDDGNPDNDGPNPPCGTAARQLGRLPRQTFTFGSPIPEADQQGSHKRLSFHERRSDIDQQLWYAVSSGFINNPVATIVNPGTRGTLRVDQRQDIVAVIIAPGPALPGQHRGRPGDLLSAYLEGENADGDLHFSRQKHAGANDRLVAISRADLLPELERRVLGFVRGWFHVYQLKQCPDTLDCYPYAAEGLHCVSGADIGSIPLLQGSCATALTDDDTLDGVTLRRHWFIRNRWQEYIRYSVDPVCRLATDVQCRLETFSGSSLGFDYSLVSVAPGESP